MAALRFRFAAPPASHSAGGGFTLTIKTDHSVGAGQQCGARPLAGIKVIEFSHMVMGLSVGAILADLGADVIKVELRGGDATRDLHRSGAGYLPMFNRDKRSVSLELKCEAGLAAASALVNSADILIENFRRGTLERLGLGYGSFADSNRRLISRSAKGFLAGPYENRTVLHEVTQMMGGLSYMTGPSAGRLGHDRPPLSGPR